MHFVEDFLGSQLYPGAELESCLHGAFAFQKTKGEAIDFLWLLSHVCQLVQYRPRT